MEVTLTCLGQRSKISNVDQDCQIRGRSTDAGAPRAADSSLHDSGAEHDRRRAQLLQEDGAYVRNVGHAIFAFLLQERRVTADRYRFQSRAP